MPETAAPAHDASSAAGDVRARGPRAPGFAALLRMARASLADAEGRSADAVAALVDRARRTSDAVPEPRRGDWQKLLEALARTGDGDERTTARLEGLVRACTLFEEQRRTAARAARPPVVTPPPAALDGVEVLPGLGPSARIALAEHGIRTVADLVWLPPVAWDDLREPLTLAEAVSAARSVHEASGGAVRPARVALRALVRSSGVVPIRGRRAVRVVLEDESDKKCTLHAFWFFMAHGVLASAKPGAAVLLVGRLTAEPKKPARAAHPELLPDGPATRIVRARYPRLGPPEVTLRKAIAHALGSVAPDPVPPAVAVREGLPPAASVLAEVHGLTGSPAGDAARLALHERLAWAEAFTRVWERLASERHEGRVLAPLLPAAPAAVRALEKELAFRFTTSQIAAIADVSRDLEGPGPMRRLLLGDVGTGKTAVALAAAAQCVSAGYQVAILAPTSVLAEQYVDAAAPLARALGVELAFVAAGLPAAERKRAAAALA
ncbi:MAG: ATP-dependent helicase RecG, partial [Labilithrix sp.]|nr:ATP-dependent helicase RecG [Labilithrix sp.]